MHISRSLPANTTMPYAAILTGFTTGATLIMAIGAQNTFVLQQGLKKNHVLLTIAVCAFGDMILILAGVAGMGTLIQAWPELLQGLRFGGAAFLGWYALQAAKHAWYGTSTLTYTATQSMDWRKVLLSCMILTFINPHVYLDTLVLIGTLSTQYAATAQWFFGLGACMASVIWFTSLGYGARMLIPIFQRPLAWRILDACIAVCMFALCVLLLTRPLV